MNRVMWPLGILLLVGSLLGAAWALNQSTPHADANNGQTAGDDVLPEVYSVGMVDLEKGIVHLYPKQPGEVAEIAEIKVKQKGGEVDRKFEKGEVLLKLNNQMAEHQLAKARAALRAAQNDLAKAKQLAPAQKINIAMQEAAIRAYGHEKAKLEAELENKKKTAKAAGGIELNKDILKAMQEAVSGMDEKINIEKGKLELLKLSDPELDIGRAEADVEAKTSDVKMAELALQDFELKAPSNGTVLRLNTRVAEVLGPNPKAAAIEFCPDEPRIVRAEVMQEWGHKVRVGQETTIEDDTYKGTRWQGRVKSVADFYGLKQLRIIEPFYMNDVRTMECIIEVTGGQAENRLRIGQRVRIKIKVGS